MSALVIMKYFLKDWEKQIQMINLNIIGHKSKLIKGKKLPSSKEVAIYGYKAMIKNKRIVFPGISNYLMANGVRFLPRNIVVKIARFLQNK